MSDMDYYDGIVSDLEYLAMYCENNKPIALECKSGSVGEDGSVTLFRGLGGDYSIEHIKDKIKQMVDDSRHTEER